MTYDIFVIYFLFAPAIALTMGIIVSYPMRIVKYFVLLSLISSLIFSLIFSLYDYLLVSLNIKKINFYFLNTQESFGNVSLLQFSSFFVIPWFINSLALLIDRFYPKATAKIINKKSKIKKINFKVVISLILIIFTIGIFLLLFNFYFPKERQFRMLSLNLTLLSPLFILIAYIRKKKKFLFITEFNISSIILSTYIIISSFFISEFPYNFRGSTILYPLEDIFYTFFLYFLAGEITVTIIALFYDKMIKKNRKKDVLFVKRKSPFFQKIFYYEEDKKETIFPNSEDNE